MSVKKQICSMDGCENELRYKAAKLCESCYQFMHYWRDRTVTDRMKHVHKIERWNKRVHSTFLPQKKPSLKVVPLKNKGTAKKTRRINRKAG